MGRGARDLTAPQRRFLAAGAEAEAAREQARRRTTGRLRRLAAGLAVALVLVVAGGLVALDQRGDARAAQKDAVAAQLATSRQRAAEARTKHFADPLDSVRQALGAWEAAPTPEARGALLFAQQTGVIGRLGTEPGACRVAVSPDGTPGRGGLLDGRIQALGQPDPAPGRARGPAPRPNWRRWRSHRTAATWPPGRSP